jgi:PAS domain S-box-containing protein
MSGATSNTTDDPIGIAGGDFARKLAREAPDAIIYADAKGNIHFWNRGAERIFGFPEQEALGRSLDIIIPEGLRARHWAGYSATMQSGSTRYGAGEILAVPAMRKDGQRISIEFTILPFRDDAGRMQGIVAILRDVTARFEEIRALRRQLGTRTPPAAGDAGSSGGDTPGAAITRGGAKI